MKTIIFLILLLLCANQVSCQVSSSFNNGIPGVSGQQEGQGARQGGPSYGSLLPDNAQMGQWMGTALDAFNSWLASLQKQWGNSINPAQGNFMGTPQAMLSTLQELRGQAGQQFGQIFPSLLSRPEMNNQMGSSQINRPLSSKIDNKTRPFK